MCLSYFLVIITPFFSINHSGFCCCCFIVVNYFVWFLHTHYCTKVWALEVFVMFLKVDYAQTACIYLIKKYSKNSNNGKYYYNLIWAKLILFLFSAALLQSSVSYDPSEIILICWLLLTKLFYYYYYFYIFILLSILKTVVLLNSFFVETWYIVETVIHFQESLMNIKFNRTAIFLKYIIIHF